MFATERGDWGGGEGGALNRAKVKTSGHTMSTWTCLWVSAPDGPARYSQNSLTRTGVLTAWGPPTHCCGLASGAFGASEGLQGRPAMTAQTIEVSSPCSHPPPNSTS